ncbi:cytochrome P450 [Lophiotrema nucula]|uniref:Cytochrome P450 n=1 Tax=Lophiotrema nucula TaxID=690887 RepID=A0A6A5Z469_9PLEO|nr:cytochrome P450 [Lophiotrema nucula]
MTWSVSTRLLLKSISAISIEKVALLVGVAVMLRGISVVVYRLHLSPLARFPGPKVAASTGLYEFYHDFFRRGKYIFEIEKMHKKYGPIVRINPDELSIHDPSFYSSLYVTGSVRRTNNYSHFARGVGFEDSHFLSTEHDLHRRRRKPLDPYFSRQGVKALEATLVKLADRLMCRLGRLKGSGKLVRLDHAYVAFAGDVMSALCCETTTNLVEDEHFGKDWFDLLHDFIQSIPLAAGFPQIILFANLIPAWMLNWAEPRLKTFNNFKRLAKKHILEAKAEKRKLTEDFSNRDSVFRHMLDSGLPESDLTLERLTREAQVLLGAGSVTTARTLSFITFYLLANTEFKLRLQSELKELMKDYPNRMPTWAELERLPYLQALIKEGLRLSYGVMHRLPRVSPDTDIQYQNWTIPAGVPVGMSAYLMHTDPDVYPNPFTFNPDRWLGDVPAVMTRNLVPFSKGSRICLGMNLAYAELNIVLSILFGPRGPTIALFETEEEDIVQAHDFLIPLPKLTSKGLRITVE